MPVASFDPPTVVNGSCGTKSGTFAAATTVANWNTLSYCASGTNTTSPAFPAVGGSTSWVCARGTVSAEGKVKDDAGSIKTAWRWVIRTSANDAKGIHTQDITYSTQSFSISTLDPNTYKVYLAVQRRGVWSGWVWREITVSNASCTAARSYYTCGETPPPGSTICLNDNTGVTTATNWASVGTTSAGCTTTRKCEYYIPTYSCTGEDPANATMCPPPNDDSDLSAKNKPAKNLVPNCGYTSRGALVERTPKCQFICDSGFYYDQESRSCIANPVSYSCLGEGPSSTAHTEGCPSSAALNSNIAWEYVDTCSPSLSENCKYKCVDGYSRIDGECKAPLGCGTNSKIFSYNENGWPNGGSFCNQGSPNPSESSLEFPNPAELVTWTCDLGRTSCSASRQRNLNWEETSPSN